MSFAKVFAQVGGNPKKLMAMGTAILEGDGCIRVQLDAMPMDGVLIIEPSTVVRDFLRSLADPPTPSRPGAQDFPPGPRRRAHTALDALVNVIKSAGSPPLPDAAKTQLMTVLHTYELTGDHNHGCGPLAPGQPCPGGDCLVTQARDLLMGG